MHVVFLWLPTADLAVERVASRVRMGGHSVSEDVVRRRHRAGMRNFFDLYKPLADSWRVFDSSHASGPRLIALGSRDSTTLLKDEATWKRIQEEWSNGTQER